jgi:hypothetical protein
MGVLEEKEVTGAGCEGGAEERSSIGMIVGGGVEGFGIGNDTFSSLRGSEGRHLL